MNTCENLKKKPPVLRMKDDKCRFLMEGEVPVQSERNKAICCVRAPLVLGKSELRAFDSSLPRNHTCHVALAGILNNEWSYWMAHASPQLHVFNYPTVSVTKMKFSSLSGLLMTKDSSVVTSQNSLSAEVVGGFGWRCSDLADFTAYHPH